MEATAKATGVRITPRKVRLVIDLVRGKSVADALGILANVNKSATPIVEKLFKDIAQAKDRTVEVAFFMELMQPLKKYFPHFYMQLSKNMEKLKGEKKE